MKSSRGDLPKVDVTLTAGEVVMIQHLLDNYRSVFDKADNGGFFSTDEDYMLFRKLLGRVREILPDRRVSNVTTTRRHH